MTSTRERREEYSSANVVRVLHPSRPYTPSQNVNDLDNNLDNLLEDLQASVSRPGSSLGQPITNYSQNSQIQYLQPANLTSVVRERSTSPSVTTSNERKVYKTAKYEYKTTTNRANEPVTDVYQRNINQLDTLLNDLEHERDPSLDRNSNTRNVGIDSGLIEPGSKVIKTTTTTYSSGGNKQPVARELVFDSPDTHQLRQSRSKQRSPPYENQSTITTVKTYNGQQDTGLYGGIRAVTPQRTVTPVTNEDYYTETKVNNTPVQYTETVTYDSPEKVLQHIPLSDEMLPKPGTKVTTTVRTYTYELPPEHEINSKLRYTNETVNQTTNTLPIITYPERDVSPAPPPHTNPSTKTVVIKNETLNTSNNLQEYPVPSLINQTLPQNSSKTFYYKRDTKQSSTNYYPTDGGHPQQPSHPVHEAIEPAPHSHPVGGVLVYPPPPPPIKYTNEQPYPPHVPANNTYIYKETTTNTTNKYPGHPPQPYNGHPPQPIYKDHGHPPQPIYKDHGHPPQPIVRYSDQPDNYQPQPIGHPPTVTYKYSSTITNATRNVYPPPEEREPLLQPFPTDGFIPDQTDGNPPKHLHDLMATFGDNGPITYSTTRKETHEKPVAKRAAIEPQKPMAAVEPVEPDTVARSSKNIAGPPVYYPPGHEMFAKKESEEGGAAWRAQGQYSKASGKYMYESESKSKSSSKSGAAVVPVCLPLCCAMPCTIM